MSRVGKQQIEIPEKTGVSVSDGVVSVKGPLGELSRSFKSDILIEVKDKKIAVAPASNLDDAKINALWGTYTSHIANMVGGVNKLFEKKLVVEGIGFKVELSGNDLILNVGFSHPVKISVPANLKATVEKML